MSSYEPFGDVTYQRRMSGWKEGHDVFMVALCARSAVTTEDVLHGLVDLIECDRSEFAEMLKRWSPKGPIDAEDGMHPIMNECLRCASDRVVLVTLLGELGEPVSSCVHESVSEAARKRMSLTRWNLRRIIRNSNDDQAIVDMIELMLDKGARAPDDIAGLYRHIDEYKGNRQGIYELLMTNPQLWGWGHPDAPCMDIKPALRRG